MPSTATNPDYRNPLDRYTFGLKPPKTTMSWSVDDGSVDRKLAEVAR